MSPHGEELAIRLLQDLTDAVSEVKSDIARVTGEVIRLNTAFEDFRSLCRMTHREVDRRLEGLETFEENTGNHNLSELQKQVAARKEWNTWAVRAMAGVVLTVLGGAVLLLLKGCA